jgi:biotin transport system substrate-specific component
VSEEFSVPSSGLASNALSSRLGALPIVLAGSVLVAVSAHIALPLFFTPVPLTLQTLAVLFLGLVLPPRLAAAALTAYLLEGAAGLPVFAPTPAMSGGVAHLFGPTGGYLLAYPIAAALVGFVWRRTRRGFATAAMSAAAGSLLIMACGALWLESLTHAPASSLLTASVIPFLPGDALKVMAAAAVAAGVLRVRNLCGSESRGSI